METETIRNADDYLVMQSTSADIKAKLIEELIATRDGAIADLAKMGWKKPRIRTTPKPASKKRGRPSGSKNAPKAADTPEAVA